MTAMLINLLFAAAAMVGAGTLMHAWQAYRHRFAKLSAQLREVERGVSVRFVRRESGFPTGTVYRLHFTPRTDCLPYHPEREFRAAA